jgi:hypothetical protein
VEPHDVSSAERRLQDKLGPNTHIDAWARAWVSRAGRMHAVFAARNLDFAVLTSDRLFLFSTGFFSRHPRRRVYDVALDRLHVERQQVKRGLQLRLWSRDHRALLLDLRPSAQNVAFVEALVARTTRPADA